MVAHAKPKGVSGALLSGGYVVSDYHDANFNDSRRYETFADIQRNVSIVAAGVRLYLGMVAKPYWSATPADLGPNGRKTADDAASFVEALLYGMRTSWPRIVQRQAMYRLYGFAAQEWTARRDDASGRIMLADVSARQQRTLRRWDVEDSGELRGVWQTAPMTGREIYLPRSRLLYSVDDALADGPEGLGVLRQVAEASARLKNYLALEQVGHQTNLQGVPVVYGPFGEIDEAERNSEITKEDAAKMRAPSREFIDNHLRARNSGLLLDSSTHEDSEGKLTAVRKWSVELLQGSGGVGAEIGAAIQRLNEEIARVLGVEHLLLGSGSSGSRSLGDTKVTQLALMIEGALRDITEAVERDLIAPIWALNGLDPLTRPTLKTESVKVYELGEMVNAIRELAAAGAVLSPRDEAVREVYGIMGLTPPAIEGGADSDGDAFSELPELSGEEEADLDARG